MNIYINNRDITIFENKLTIALTNDSFSFSELQKELIDISTDFNIDMSLIKIEIDDEDYEYTYPGFIATFPASDELINELIDKAFS